LEHPRATAEELAALDDVIRAAERQGDIRLEALGHRARCWVLINGPQLLEAMQALERSLFRAQCTGNVNAEAYVYWMLSVLNGRRGRLRAASLGFATAAAAARRLGDSYRECAVLNAWGVYALELGRIDEAQLRLDEARRRAAEGGFTVTHALALNNLGSVALARGDIAAARSLHAAALDLYGGLSVGPFQAYAIGCLGRCDAAEGDVTSARARWREALSGAAQQHVATWALELAEAALAERQLDVAAAHLHDGLVAVDGTFDELLAAKLLCARARVEAAAGDDAAARATLADVEVRMAPMELEPESDLTRRWQRARAAVGGGAAPY
jgi:tetratricopeptide (TPR) repeat protein